jgi:hypothetical protein
MMCIHNMQGQIACYVAFSRHGIRFNVDIVMCIVYVCVIVIVRGKIKILLLLLIFKQTKLCKC